MDDSLFQAVYVNDLDTVRKLLDDPNVNINKMDRLGRTPLQIACYFGFYEVCKVLLERGANADDESLRRAKNGWDGFSQCEIIELLHDSKKEIETPDT